MSTCLPSCNNFAYMSLGLVSEVGELTGKVAKAVRKEEITLFVNDLYCGKQLPEDGGAELHKGLIGVQWQEKISEIDALLLPYSAKRYLYHWGGMLFTAIGFKKPVVTSDDMNPEVFELFHIGETFASGNLTELKRVLEDFVNGFDANVEIYRDALDKASEEFSPEMFARLVEAIIKA